LKASSDSDQKELLKLEQVKLLYAAMPVSVLATLIIAAVLVVVEWDVTDHKLSIAWLVSILIVTFTRHGLSFFYHRTQPEVERTTDWEIYFTIGSIAAGVVWGSTSLLLFPESSVVHQVFVAFMVGGICAGAVTTLSPLPLPIFSFLLLALGPLIVRFFMIGTEITNAMGAMTSLFLIMISINAFRTYRNIRQNITLRMQSQMSEAVLAENEHHLLMAIQRHELHESQTAIGIIEWNTDFTVRSWNSGAEKIFGFNSSDAIGKHVTELILSPSVREHIDQIWQDLLAQKGGTHNINENITQSGETIICEWYNTPLVQDEENVIGVYSLVSDISDRQRQHNELSKLKQAIEQTGESVVITDKDGIIEYVNPSFTRITGYGTEEVLGKNTRILKSGIQTVEYYKKLWSTITGGKIWHGSVMNRRKDGSQYPAIMSIAPIFDDDGQITHYVGIQQDMTDHEVLEEKFRQAQKMEALGTLVGGIAHDFNNMLAGMTGNLYLAKKKVADRPDVLKRLNTVEELSYRAAEMIKQLLAFARKDTVEMKPFGLTSFIQEVSKLNKASIPENISFHSKFCREELVVKGDATQLQQVLMNLLSNAHDAVSDVPEPKISLTIDEFEADEHFLTTHSEVEGRLFAHLVVKDNGTGINDEDKEHIFEPFYTTKEIGVGTGLGLAMSYGTIQSHGGILEVESTPGEGSSFHIYLPLLEEKKIDVESEELNEAVSGNGELILVVDDNADIRTTSTEVLESLGYRVLEASDGLQAVDIFASNQNEIALIIMDIVMPRLGGVQAVERIKALCPDTKVIFASGYDKDETLKGEMPSDEDVMLSKPYNVIKLSQVIREQLDS
jgi:PAS domain S-box-containing protein